MHLKWFRTEAVKVFCFGQCIGLAQAVSRLSTLVAVCSKVTVFAVALEQDSFEACYSILNSACTVFSSVFALPYLALKPLCLCLRGWSFVPNQVSVARGSTKMLLPFRRFGYLCLYPHEYLLCRVYVSMHKCMYVCDVMWCDVMSCHVMSCHVM